MARPFVVLALIFLAVGGLTSARDTPLAPSPIEATNAAPDGSPTASEGPISQSPSEAPEGPISAPPTAGGPIAASPSHLDEEGFPIDPVSPPAPEIQSPPPPVASTEPPSATPVPEAPQSGAATLKISFVIVLAAFVGAFSL